VGVGVVVDGVEDTQLNPFQLQPLTDAQAVAVVCVSQLTVVVVDPPGMALELHSAGGFGTVQSTFVAAGLRALPELGLLHPFSKPSANVPIIKIFAWRISRNPFF
jgi:hypothetical protein